MADYPDRLQDVFYGLQKQAPSYQSEFPHELPFDPGATSGFFELNYFPSFASRLLLLIPVVLLVLLLVFRKKLRNDIGQIGFFVSMALVFFGPLRSPPLVPFGTTLGIVKAIGVLLAVYLGLMYVTKKIPFDVVIMPSILRVALYIISLLLSVFVMTNPTFFWQDFGIMMTGILFYFLSYAFFTWDLGKTLLRVWAWALVIPSAIVLFVFVSNSAGIQLMNLLFQKYENFVFLHDLIRNRIFSIMDFEYFVACSAILIVNGSRTNSRFRNLIFSVVVGLSFAAILLVNYRYRFLTFILGLFSISFFAQQYSTKIRKIGFRVVGIVAVAYLIFSVMFFRSTILDRFLVRNYSEDQVSIDRRFVMYRQAWEIFLERPLLGVGMGNYKDNVQIVYSRFGGRTYEPYYKILQSVYAYPHNWFLTSITENGMIGFLILLWVLSQFWVMDVHLYHTLKKEQFLEFLIISTISWSWVFANMFTMMHVSLPTVIVFWACRGMIERIYVQSAN